VDFIFGWATAVFDSCQIFCKSEGFITAASTEEQSPYGFVFLNCNISGDAPKHSVYLGRPWRPFAKVAFINCKLAELIRPEGWHNWDNVENEKTADFAEFKSSGPGSHPDKRVKWARELTQKDLDTYALKAVFGDWTPF
jgi:pectinesterase